MTFGPATYGLGLIAGALSTLSPCVLPLVPLVIGETARRLMLQCTNMRCRNTTGDGVPFQRGLYHDLSESSPHHAALSDIHNRRGYPKYRQRMSG
jgi:hypothetical protein